MFKKILVTGFIAFLILPLISYAEEVEDFSVITVTSLKDTNRVQVVAPKGSILKKSYVVEGSLSLNDNVTIDGNLIVNGDLTLGSDVKILGHVVASGDIKIGNDLFILGTLKGQNIHLGPFAKVSRVIARGNLTTLGSATIREGVYVRSDFDAGSELQLSGPSKVLGNLIVGPYSVIGGTLYVYKSMQTSFEFLFDGEKLKVIGDFRAIYGPEKPSSLKGRVHMYGNKGYKYFYGNRLLFNFYETFLTNFDGVMGQIDPVLNYKLSEDETNQIKQVIEAFQKDIRDQKKNIEYVSKRYPKSNKIVRKKQQIYQTFHNMFSYISTHLESESWDKTKFKEIQMNEATTLKIYLSQFDGDIDYSIIDDLQNYEFSKINFFIR